MHHRPEKLKELETKMNSSSQKSETICHAYEKYFTTHPKLRNNEKLLIKKQNFSYRLHYEKKLMHAANFILLHSFEEISIIFCERDGNLQKAFFLARYSLRKCEELNFWAWIWLLTSPTTHPASKKLWIIKSKSYYLWKRPCMCNSRVLLDIIFSASFII